MGRHHQRRLQSIAVLHGSLLGSGFGYIWTEAYHPPWTILYHDNKYNLGVFKLAANRNFVQSIIWSW
jgi:hypothetical protein